jgi:hypothetical protein
MKPTLIFKLFLTIITMQCFFIAAYSQTLTQTVKGSVFDAQTKETLIGATVLILNSEPLLGSATNVNGNYTISRVPVGRHSIQVNFIGYEPVIIPEILVTSAREEVVNIGLRQSVTELDALIVTPEIVKNRPLNSMATVGSRSFSVEEARRYAGALDDPARLVSAYAGVAVGNLQDNAIIVRGNSPKGISWRLEGVEIPTPHHLAGGNVAGGGLVTLFSSQMLANSDFHTSAFPAEFGNALAGVFDMNLRVGNSETHERTFQAGTMGLDIASEGPLARGSNASYLFNYRYSTLGLLTDINIIPSDQQIRYQDLSFKLNLPTKSAGTFILWGIGGKDKVLQPLETDQDVWESDWDRNKADWLVDIGATGLTHRFFTGNRTYINTTLAATGLKYYMETERQDDNLVPHPDLLVDENSGTLSFHSYLSHSFSPVFSTKTGITLKSLYYNLDINSTIDSDPSTYRNLVNERGNSTAMEFYTQSRYNLSKNLLMNTGVHVGYFALNNSLSVDPRIAFSLDLNRNHAVSLGYGHHSQMEELKIYMIKQQENGVVSLPNKDLGLSKAHHFVLAYDWQINRNLRFKLEPYLQLLYDAPGIAGTSYSLINFKQERAFGDALENNSIGRNFGVDATFERFLSNGYYFLLAGSVFSSRYKADDGIWRNTRYNRNFVANALVGREFTFQNNRKVLGINTRFNVVGGERVTPILEEKSAERQLVFFDESQAFSNQLATTVYAHLSVTYRINRSGHSSIWAFQIKNLLGQAMPEGYNYNYKTRRVELDKSVIIIPAISYKIEF